MYIRVLSALKQNTNPNTQHVLHFVRRKQDPNIARNCSAGKGYAKEMYQTNSKRNVTVSKTAIRISFTTQINLPLLLVLIG